MKNVILIANLLIILGQLIGLFASTRNDKKQILIWQCVSMAVMSSSSILLKGYSAVVQDVISITRNILSLCSLSSKSLQIGFVAAAVILGILFNNRGILGLLPMAATVAQNIVILNKDATKKQLQLACAFSAFCWVIYNLTIMAYAGAVLDGFNGISYLYHALRSNEEETQGGFDGE